MPPRNDIWATRSFTQLWKPFKVGWKIWLPKYRFLGVSLTVTLDHCIVFYLDLLHVLLLLHGKYFYIMTLSPYLWFYDMNMVWYYYKASFNLTRLNSIRFDSIHCSHNVNEYIHANDTLLYMLFVIHKSLNDN